MNEHYCRIYIKSYDTTMYLVQGVDLIVTSPPYWNLKRYTNNPKEIGSTQSWEDYLLSMNSFLKLSYSALKPGKILAIIVSDLKTTLPNVHNAIKPIAASIITLAEKIDFEYLGDIIWRKTARFGWRIRHVRDFPVPQLRFNYEHILIFRKPGIRNSSGSGSVDQDQAHTSRSGSVDQDQAHTSSLRGQAHTSRFVRKITTLPRSLERRLSYGIWKVRGAKQTRSHSAQFPIEIPKRLIQMFSNIGEVVLDPFVGTGTTLEAALNLNRSCIGIDIDEACLPLMLDRLRRVKNDFNLTIHAEHNISRTKHKSHKTTLKII